MLETTDNPGARRCQIPRIDELYSGASVPPLRQGDDPAAIGALQDLLSGHAYRGMPPLTAPARGTFGPATRAALNDFQQRHGLSVRPEVDGPTLSLLIGQPASDPRATPVYLTLALGFPPGGLCKLLCLTAQMEGMGRFGALNPNTDRAGLSFGIVQWAQRPGRLAELLATFEDRDPLLFAQILGAGDTTLARRLLEHLRQPNGGVDAAGQTTDPAFDLLDDPWTLRFQQAARAEAFQQAQVQAAACAFQQARASIVQVAPTVTSERGVAFLLDVANQFGIGGMHQLCRDAADGGLAETGLLEAVADETVERMPDPFKMAVRSRRDTFLHTPLLSDEPFSEAA